MRKCGRGLSRSEHFLQGGQELFGGKGFGEKSLDIGHGCVVVLGMVGDTADSDDFDFGFDFAEGADSRHAIHEWHGHIRQDQFHLLAVFGSLIGNPQFSLRGLRKMLG